MNGVEFSTLIPNGFNALLVILVGFLLRNKLKDIECRLTRIENTFFKKMNHD
jgi:hypothetical protein